MGRRFDCLHVVGFQCEVDFMEKPAAIVENWFCFFVTWLLWDSLSA
jgi:Zn-dependent oligopeptidase